MDEMLLARQQITGKGHPTQRAWSNLSLEAAVAQEGQQEGQQGLGRAVVVPAHAPDHVAPRHAAPAARIETQRKRWLQSHWQRGHRLCPALAGGQNKRGPVLVQAWVEMFKHVRGSE